QGTRKLHHVTRSKSQKRRPQQKETCSGISCCRNGKLRDRTGNNHRTSVTIEQSTLKVDSGYQAVAVFYWNPIWKDFHTRLARGYWLQHCSVLDKSGPVNNEQRALQGHLRWQQQIHFLPLRDRSALDSTYRVTDGSAAIRAAPSARRVNTRAPLQNAPYAPQCPQDTN